MPVSIKAKHLFVYKEPIIWAQNHVYLNLISFKPPKTVTKQQISK